MQAARWVADLSLMKVRAYVAPGTHFRMHMDLDDGPP